MILHARSAARSNLNLQMELEEKRNVGFGEILDSLTTVGLFDQEDSETAKSFYRQVRIPVHHGLPARFVRDHGVSWDIRNLLRRGEPVTSHELEEIVEDKALENIEIVVGILERNCGAVG